jgi:hypothetical protein
MSIKLALTHEKNVVTRTWFNGEKTITAKHHLEPYELKPDEHLVLVKEYDSLSFMGVREEKDYYDDDVFISLWVLNNADFEKGKLRPFAGMGLDLHRFLKTGSVLDLCNGKVSYNDDLIVLGCSKEDDDDPIATIWTHRFCRLLYCYTGTLDEFAIQRELRPDLFKQDTDKKMCVNGIDGTFLIIPNLSLEFRLNLNKAVDTAVEIGKTYKVVYGKPEKFTLTVIRHSKLVFEVTAIDF